MIGSVQEAMEGLLGRWNCTIRVAASLGEAMTVLSGGGFQPDIILADQHLDRATLGSETITEARKLLKRTSRPSSSPPIPTCNWALQKPNALK